MARASRMWPASGRPSCRAAPAAPGNTPSGARILLGEKNLGTSPRIVSNSKQHEQFGVAPLWAGSRKSMIANMTKRGINKNHISPIYSSKLAFLAIVTFTSILLITCLVTQRVSSLNCYTCSSADNPGCDESFSGRANFTADTDCERQTGRQAKVCRKIVQYLEDKKVVIRSCGWIDEHAEKKAMCYKRSGTFALMMESCICYEDNCNHSTSLVPNRSVSILLAGGAMIFCYLIGKQRYGLH